MSDLRNRILAVDDLAIETMDVPEWGVKIEVRSPTAGTRARLMSDCIDLNTQQLNLEKLYPALVIATVYDPETGEQVFSEADVNALQNKSGAVMERIALVGMRVAGMNESAVDEGKDGSSAISLNEGSTSI